MAGIHQIRYEQINLELSWAQYDDVSVIIDSDGYIGITQLCKQVNKKYKDWRKTKGSKTIFKSFGIVINKEEGEERQISRKIDGNPVISGIYIHPKIAPFVAYWISADLAYKVSAIIEDRQHKILVEKNHELTRRIEDIKKKNLQLYEELKQDNVKTHAALHEISITNVETRSQFDRINTDVIKTYHMVNQVKSIVDKISEHVVPPAEREELHEVFGVYKTNDDKCGFYYQTYRAQSRCVPAAVKRIIKQYPHAEKLIEIGPTPNSRNILHRLKEKYGDKLTINYNAIVLECDTSEDDLYTYIMEVADEKYEYGSGDRKNPREELL